MKKHTLLLIAFGIFFFLACKKEDSDKFRLLTATTWRSDSLLVNGVDASAPGGLLEKFKGDVRFNEDGTGTFGTYTGTWEFFSNETQLRISSAELPLGFILANIVQITATDLKVKTTVPNPLNPLTTLNIRMTFKPK